MAANFPGPNEVEIVYTVESVQHKMRLNCELDGTPQVGDLPSTIDVKRRDGMTTQLDLAVDAWCDLLRVRFNITSTFDSYTVWSYAPLTNDRTFITTGALALNGTHANAATLAGQSTLTFRTTEGNNMRIVMLESIDTDNTRIPYANLNVNVQAIMDFIVDPTNWIKARDTSFPIAVLNGVGGQNESVFKARFR